MSIMTHYSSKPAKRNNGFTLLEVLVALVIFSIGLLGLAGLEAQSLRFNHGAYLRTQATFMAYDILDRMRANKDAAINNNYSATFASPGSNNSCNSSTATCSTAAMAQHDIFEWKNLLNALPNGQGSVTKSGDVYVIVIQWDDPEPGDPANKSDITLRSEL